MSAVTSSLPDDEASVVEVVEFVARTSAPAALEDAIRSSIDLLKAARGYRGHVLGRSAERASTVMLLVYWTSLESHTRDFRGSPEGRRWPAALDPHLAQPPRVVHCLAEDRQGREGRS